MSFSAHDLWKEWWSQLVIKWKVQMYKCFCEGVEVLDV